MYWLNLHNGLWFFFYYLCYAKQAIWLVQKRLISIVLVTFGEFHQYHFLYWGLCLKPPIQLVVLGVCIGDFEIVVSIDNEIITQNFLHQYQWYSPHTEIFAFTLGQSPRWIQWFQYSVNIFWYWCKNLCVTDSPLFKRVQVFTNVWFEFFLYWYCGLNYGLGFCQKLIDIGGFSGNSGLNYYVIIIL